MSEVLGMLRPRDRIPAYRLSGDRVLPGIGPVAAHWRSVLDPVARDCVGDGLLVDLRSTTYAGFWRPAGDLAHQTATVRVLHESGGRRLVVSHFNKATKGRIVRAILQDGSRPRSPARLGELLRDLGWTVEEAAPGPSGVRFDVVVREL